MKQCITLSLSVVLVCLVLNGGGFARVEAEPVVLNVGEVTTPGNEILVSWEDAARYINEKAEGRLEIRVFHSGALGAQDTRELDLQQGLYDLSTLPPASMTTFYKSIGVLNAPFIFRDADHMLKVVNSDIGQTLLKDFEAASGITALGVWYYGTRHLTSNILGTTPDELSKVKMRIYNAPIAYEFASALGTKATPIDFNELYLALKTGTVDAQENPIPTIYDRKFYEVQKYLILTGHVVAPVFPVANSGKWNALDDELKALVLEGIEVATQNNLARVGEKEQSLIAELQAQGMEIIALDDKAPFYESAQKIYQKYEQDWGADTVVKIKAVQ